MEAPPLVDSSSDDEGSENILPVQEEAMPAPRRLATPPPVPPPAPLTEEEQMKRLQEEFRKHYKYGRPPYATPLLSLRTREDCSVCHRPLEYTTKEQKLVPTYCSKCGYISCGDAECRIEDISNHGKHICPIICFQNARDLVPRLYRLPSEDPKERLDPLSVAHCLWVICRLPVGLSATREAKSDPAYSTLQVIVDTLRQRGGFGEMMAIPMDGSMGQSPQEVVEEEKEEEKKEEVEVKEEEKKRKEEEEQAKEEEKKRKEEEEQAVKDAAPKTLGDYAAMSRGFLAYDSIGGEESKLMELFGAHLMEAHPHGDTMAQLYQYYSFYWELHGMIVRDVAGLLETARTETGIKYFTRERLQTLRSRYHLLQVGLNRETGLYFVNPFCENPDDKNGDMLRLFFDRDLMLGNGPLNILWHLTLIHCAKEEALATLKMDKYDQRKENFELGPRPLSTQLLLRIMGDPSNPQLLVMQSHSTFYSLERWMSGRLVSEQLKKLGNDERDVDFDILHDRDPRFKQEKNVGDKDAYLASLRLRHLVEEPRLARPLLQGKVELNNIASLIHTLCSQDFKKVSSKERQKAYMELTGVRVPMLRLQPFICIAGRANFVQ